MFKLEFAKSADETYKNLQTEAYACFQKRSKSRSSKSTPQEGLFKQLVKCLSYLEKNPKHPSLKTHKFDSIQNPLNPTQPVFEAYVQNKTPGAYRVFWCYGPKKEMITILAITPHP